jgi:hypothetical protein
MRFSLGRFVLLSLASLALLCTVACRAAPRPPQPTPDMAEVAGTYALVSVDGRPVPAMVSHEGAALEVRSGSFNIGIDGRCSTTTVFVPPSGREVAREVRAVYAKDGSRLTIWWDGAGTTTGTVDGTTFTMVNEGMEFVYRR